VLREHTLYGYDFDQTMSRISLMNLMMHGINNPHIKQINTLSARYDEEKHYTVVLNPPFKGSIDELEIGASSPSRQRRPRYCFWNSCTPCCKAVGGGR